MPRFFIDRPIFAWVVAILITLAGTAAIFNLPVSAYPPIAPPQASINASYPGASAEVVEKTVTSVIEQQLTGVDNLIYFESTSRSNGTVQITLTFLNGTDPDIAVVQAISRAGYRSLLEAGVRVFEWNGPMIHAKSAVADGRWARVGSTNLNISSWVGNWELDLVIENEDFARRMEEQYLEDLKESWFRRGVAIWEYPEPWESQEWAPLGFRNSIVLKPSLEGSPQP